MNHVHVIPGIAAAIALACAAPVALAQTVTPPPHPQSGASAPTPALQRPPLYNKHQQKLPACLPKAAVPTGWLGGNAVAGTVQSVAKDGIVDVHTDAGDLKLPFSDTGKQLRHLKRGDKVTLHLSYSVGVAPPPSSSLK